MYLKLPSIQSFLFQKNIKKLPVAVDAGGAVNIHPVLVVTLVEFVPAYQAAPPVAFELRMLK
jgi:hypothetical protein